EISDPNAPREQAAAYRGCFDVCDPGVDLAEGELARLPLERVRPFGHAEAIKLLDARQQAAAAHAVIAVAEDVPAQQPRLHRIGPAQVELFQPLLLDQPKARHEARLRVRP